MYAAHLWWTLRWLGHEARGGAGRRLAGLDRGRPARFDEPGVAARPGQPPGASLAATVDAATVLAIAQPAFTVIDARASRYRGEVEPMDPVAGHIPGALNRPWREPADRRPLQGAGAVARRVHGAAGGPRSGAIVHQCGSGITACHNLLSMEIAGLSGSRLYPGSWSEWCSDPSRPVATGAVA